MPSSLPSRSLQVLLAIDYLASPKLFRPLCHLIQFHLPKTSFPLLSFPISTCVQPAFLSGKPVSPCPHIVQPHGLMQPVRRKDAWSLGLSPLRRTSFPRGAPGDLPFHLLAKVCPCLCPAEGRLGSMGHCQPHPGRQVLPVCHSLFYCNMVSSACTEVRHRNG